MIQRKISPISERDYFFYIFTFLHFYIFAFLHFYIFLHSHAGRSPQGGKDGRRYWCDDLHNPFDSFFLSHTRLKILMVKEFFGTDALILARISRINTALFYSPVSLRRSPRVWRQSTVASDFTLGPDPSNHLQGATLLWGLPPATTPSIKAH